MSEKGISYLNRTFDDYRNSLKSYIKEYYPEIADSFDDASIGSWMVDIVAAAADNLSYHIDRMYSETCVDCAQQAGSLYSIARSQGVKVPGPKGAMAECEFSCILPAVGSQPDWGSAPVILRGTKVSSRDQYFEVMEDIDFQSQFDASGVSNRKVIPAETSNGIIVSYRVIKRCVVVGGESRIYKQTISADDVRPFMEIVIPDNDVMEVTSVIFKDGVDYQSNPTMAEFMYPIDIPVENNKEQTIQRFFEVESLSDSSMWGDKVYMVSDDSADINHITVNNGVKDYFAKFTDNTWVLMEHVPDGKGGKKEVKIDNIKFEPPYAQAIKGQWNPVRHKFMTEFTDKGYMKLTFGGATDGDTVIDKDVSASGKYHIQKMLYNDFLGLLPKAGWTMYVLYRAGGGASSNVAKGAINVISYLNVCLRNTEGSEGSKIRNSISVINTTPGVSGRDAMTTEEVRNYIKYYNGAQGRCVTLKDYESRVMQMPSRYGCPFRIRAVEENNKVVIYTVGLSDDGYLTGSLPRKLSENMRDYLEQYRSINDLVQIMPGKVIDLKIDVKLYIDKDYSSSDVVKDVRNAISDYFSKDKMQLGQTVFIGDLERVIGNVDGVISLVETTVYNVVGGKHSTNKTSMPIIDTENGSDGSNHYKIDIDATDYLLTCDSDSIFEIRNDNLGDNGDISISTKIR